MLGRCVNVPQSRVGVVLGSVEDDDRMGENRLVRRLFESGGRPVNQLVDDILDYSASKQSGLCGQHIHQDCVLPRIHRDKHDGVGECIQQSGI